MLIQTTEKRYVQQKVYPLRAFTCQLKDDRTPTSTEQTIILGYGMAIS